MIGDITHFSVAVFCTVFASFWAGACAFGVMSVLSGSVLPILGFASGWFARGLN